MQMNWDKQDTLAIFPDAVWSRPETASGAGKLLIIGGSTGNMAGLAKTYAQAEQAGAGTIHLLVPDSLAKVTKQISFVQYGRSNRSGGFAKEALAEFLAATSAVDGALLSGDLGKNSETSLMLESFAAKYPGFLAVTSDALHSFAEPFASLVNRPDTLLFLDLKQLMQLEIHLKLESAITSDMPKPKLVESLRLITQKHPVTLALEIESTIWIARNGRVCQCQNINFNPAKSTVWAIQLPTKLYEAIVCSTL